MEPRPEDVVRRLMPELVASIDPVLMLPHLPCIARERHQTIRCKQESRGKDIAVQDLIEFLHGRDNWFQQFCAALRRVELNWLADKLEQSCHNPTVYCSMGHEQRRRKIDGKTPLRTLNCSIKKAFQLLDMNTLQNWQIFAEEVGYALSDINKFESHVSPSEQLLRDWSTKGEATLGRLVEVLMNMERNDILNEISQSGIEKAVSKILSHLRSVHGTNPQDKVPSKIKSVGHQKDTKCRSVGVGNTRINKGQLTPRSSQMMPSAACDSLSKKTVELGQPEVNLCERKSLLRVHQNDVRKGEVDTDVSLVMGAGNKVEERKDSKRFVDRENLNTFNKPEMGQTAAKVDSTFVRQKRNYVEEMEERFKVSDGNTIDIGTLATSVSCMSTPAPQGSDAQVLPVVPYTKSDQRLPQPSADKTFISWNCSHSTSTKRSLFRGTTSQVAHNTQSAGSSKGFTKTNPVQVLGTTVFRGPSYSDTGSSSQTELNLWTRNLDSQRDSKTKVADMIANHSASFRDTGAQIQKVTELSKELFAGQGPMPTTALESECNTSSQNSDAEDVDDHTTEKTTAVSEKINWTESALSTSLMGLVSGILVITAMVVMKQISHT